MKLKLRGKLISSIGILTFAAVFLLSLLSYVSLRIAYKKVIVAEKEKLDQIIQSQVECMVGVLEAEYEKYEDGLVTEEEAMENAKSIVRTTRYNGGSGYFWADMADGTNAVHIKPEVEGTNRYDSKDEKGNYFVRDTIAAGDKPEGGFIDFYFAKPGESEAKAKRGFIKKFEPYGWYIGTGNYEEDMLPIIQEELDDCNRSSSIALLLICVSGAAIFVVGIGVISVIARRMSDPIKEASDRLKELSLGNLKDEVCVSGSEDEIGDLTRALATTVQTWRDYIGDISASLAELDKGNLRLEMNMEYMGDFAPIKESFQRTIHTLNDTFRKLNNSALQVASSAQSLAQGTTEQASSVEELAATVNDIHDHVASNAENAKLASDQAMATATELEQGKKQMEQMTAAMNEINDSSSEISKIIKTIEDIAFQTNILALNAAVEAARAGSAGKGFAVVADEVRNLASKSAEASKNTAALIEATVRAVQEGTGIANETAQSIGRIVVASEESAKLIHQISDASQEQAASIAQVTLGIDQISSVVQTNSATSEESAAASEELSSQAQILKGLVRRFQIRETN